MITQERLKEVLTYNPDTGVFTYNIDNKANNRKKGDVAGFKIASHDKFYLAIKIDKNLYRLSHLAILYMENRLPTKIVDHADRDTLNNKYRNLREVTESQNSHNYTKPSTNTSGVKGLYKRKDGWQVRVMLHNKAYTAFFSVKADNWDLKKEEAITYLQNLRVKLHGEFACHG